MTGERYRKRPIEVEALRWKEDGSNWIACCRFLEDEDSYDSTDTTPEFLDIPTLHGQTELLPGEWIVKGPSGDFWPVRADIFAESYELASATDFPR